MAQRQAQAMAQRRLARANGRSYGANSAATKLGGNIPGSSSLTKLGVGARLPQITPLRPPEPIPPLPPPKAEPSRRRGGQPTRRVPLPPVGDAEPDWADLVDAYGLHKEPASRRLLNDNLHSVVHARGGMSQPPTAQPATGEGRRIQGDLLPPATSYPSELAQAMATVPTVGTHARNWVNFLHGD